MARFRPKRGVALAATSSAVSVQPGRQQTGYPWSRVRDPALRDGSGSRRDSQRRVHCVDRAGPRPTANACYGTTRRTGSAHGPPVSSTQRPPALEKPGRGRVSRPSGSGPRRVPVWSPASAAISASFSSRSNTAMFSLIRDGVVDFGMTRCQAARASGARSGPGSGGAGEPARRRLGGRTPGPPRAGSRPR